jgi:phosphoribosylanthranilate isomerase
VGVFVNEDPDTIKKIIQYCGLDLVQLHGDESPDLCHDLMPYPIKAFRPKEEKDLSAVKPYRGRIRALLFDTYSKEKRGGTGKTFDWELAIKGKKLGVPVILAGGLSPSNIEQAISTVRPFAVDVNSGIEDRPGKKSSALMKTLMETINDMNRGGHIR